MFPYNFRAKGKHAMGKFTLSVFINRSQQDVFDFLSDPANISKWDSDFESAEWTSSGEPRIGTTGSCERAYAHP